MDFLRYTFMTLHLVGAAAIIGPRWSSCARGEAHHHGDGVGCASAGAHGIALVGLAYANDAEPDNVKITVKLLLALVIVGLAESRGRSRPRGPSGPCLG